LSSGLFWLPHLGDWMHEGQPSLHWQALIVSRVAVSHSRAARMPVVHEDAQLAGVRMQRGRDASDVPAVAGGEERKQPDRAVLGRVRRSRQVGGRDAGRLEGMSRHAPPHRRRAECALRQVEQLLGDHLAAGHPALQERHHLVGDVDLAVRQPAVAPECVLMFADDPDVGDLARRRGVVRFGAFDHGHVLVEVQRLHEPGLAHVHVDRAGVRRAVRGRGVDGPDHPAGRPFDQLDRRPAAGADVGQV
jgi:hypothetical protein